MKRSPLKRFTPLRHRRSKPRRGEPTPEHKGSVRRRVYARSGGRCELRFKGICLGDVILPFDGGLYERGHLAHLKSRGAGGEFTEANTRWSCWRCHLIGMHQKGLKP
jgi:hypothetical protein